MQPGMHSSRAEAESNLGYQPTRPHPGGALRHSARLNLLSAREWAGRRAQLEAPIGGAGGRNHRKEVALTAQRSAIHGT
eukprot:9209086-Alexandrium_andersonii.AAC.1